MTAHRAIVIFGATGDLARRMLFPSLYFLEVDGLLPDGLFVVGCSRTAISRYTIEGDPKISWVSYKTPQLLEPIVRILLTTRIQLALHALEPQTIVRRYDIHRLPQRLRRRTHRLSPFAMYAAFPRADYYEDSAPRRDIAGLGGLPDVSVPALDCRFPCSRGEPWVR